MLSKRQKLVVPLLLMSMQSISSFMEPLANINIGSTIPTDLSKGCTIIGTHDGSFHCDEALAVSLLKLYYNFQSNSDVYIVRTRKPDILSACNVVVDVGAVYEPENHRYDHHQREFKGVMKGFNTKLSSAGLIYKHFGLDIIRYILMKTLDNNEISNEVLDLVYNKVYKDFMEHIDAIDNGISVATGEPNYHMSTGLSARVGYLNPEWNEPQSPEIMNDCFQNAMKLTCSEFLSYTVSTAKSWWPARDIVEKAVNQRFDVHESGKILLFPQPLPWKEHLFEIERMVSYC